MIYRADEGLGFLLRYENVAWYEEGSVRILDRRIYPIRLEYVVCKSHTEVAQAIADMVTQSGGPYVAAAMGMALAAYEAKEIADEKEYAAYMERAAYTLSHARPTTSAKMVAVVEGSMQRMRDELAKGTSPEEMPEALANKAIENCNANYDRFSLVAKHLADQIPNGGTVMTQCFAETIIGTLLRECRRQGWNHQQRQKRKGTHQQQSLLHPTFFRSLGTRISGWITGKNAGVFPKRIEGKRIPGRAKKEARRGVFCASLKPLRGL